MSINIYAKYTKNVYCAKCKEPHKKGDIITLTTQRGKEHECIVFNELLQKDGFYYYSIVRADGFDHQAWARRRAERFATAAANSKTKSDQAYEKSNTHADFLSLGEPIKIGHHSEKRHRRIIEQANNNMRKSIELGDKAQEQTAKAEYYERKAEEINLSMPESIDYYQDQLEKAIAHHQALKNGTIPRSHGYELAYAKKKVNELEKNVKLARKLWGEIEPTVQKPVEVQPENQTACEDPNLVDFVLDDLKFKCQVFPTIDATNIFLEKNPEWGVLHSNEDYTQNYVAKLADRGCAV